MSCSVAVARAIARRSVWHSLTCSSSTILRLVCFLLVLAIRAQARLSEFESVTSTCCCDRRSPVVLNVISHQWLDLHLAVILGGSRAHPHHARPGANHHAARQCAICLRSSALRHFVDMRRTVQDVPVGVSRTHAAVLKSVTRTVASNRSALRGSAVADAKLNAAALSRCREARGGGRRQDHVGGPARAVQAAVSASVMSKPAGAVA